MNTKKHPSCARSENGCRILKCEQMNQEKNTSMHLQLPKEKEEVDNHHWKILRIDDVLAINNFGAPQNGARLYRPRADVHTRLQ